jgi:membrane protease YdiL (CAAX protease family)
MDKKRILASGAFMAILTAALIALGRFLPFTGLRRMALYQACILALSSASIAAAWLFRRKRPEFLGAGHPAAPGSGIKLLLVKAGQPWTRTGASLMAVMTLFTGAFMVMGMAQMGKSFDPRALAMNLPWIILFSACNAWSEEAIYRLVPASIIDRDGNLKGFPLLSAVIFGAAHVWGNPGGPVGMLMSGILGWALALSVRDTRGMLWAFLIHLVQDLAIFGVMFGFGALG